MKSKRNRTVVLMGHLDTVAVDDFGSNQELAFNPEEWKMHIAGKRGFQPQSKAPVRTGAFDLAKTNS